VTVLAFAPPKLAGSEALWNAFLSHAGQPLPLAEPNTAAVFAPGTPPAATAFAIRVAPETGAPFVVQVVDFPFKAMFNVDFTAEDLPELPAELRDALVEGMVALVSRALPPETLGPLAAAGSGAVGSLVADGDLAGLEWFQLALHGLTPAPIVLAAGVERAALVDRISGVAPATRQVWPGLRSQLSEEADVTLGALAFGRRELAALTPGAVLVLPPFDAGEAAIRVGDELYSFRAVDEGWQCLGAIAGDARATQLSGDDAMEPSGDETADAPPAAGGLKVVLDFDIGRQTVSLAELESWQAGAVVALDPPRPAAGLEVTIRANGQVVGSGDLVQLDDRLGIRISRLNFRT
jgi:flagellar motor switch/type III secretory pathway protein FliN